MQSPHPNPALQSYPQPRYIQEDGTEGSCSGDLRPVQLLTRSLSVILWVADLTALPARPSSATVLRATADSFTASTVAAARSEIFSLWSISWACKNRQRDARRSRRLGHRRRCMLCEWMEGLSAI